jgi:hypothetical protein
MTQKMNFEEEQILSVRSAVLKAFTGWPYEQMPKLLADGRTPLSMKGLMERRLGMVGTSADAATLQDNYVTTANLMVRNSSGAVVVAAYEQNPFAQQVALGLNEKSVLRDGSLVEYQGMDSDELYAAVVAGGAHVEISPRQVRDMYGQNRHDAYAAPSVRGAVWREAFAEGDKVLDQEYGKLVDKVTYRDFKRNRGVNVPGYEGGRLVWCGSVGVYFSSPSGDCPLDYYDGALVGVGAGGAVASGVVAPTLEQTLSVWQNKGLSENEKVRQLTILYRQ